MTEHSTESHVECDDCGNVHPSWAEHAAGDQCPACCEERCPVADDGERCCDTCRHVQRAMWEPFVTDLRAALGDADGGGDR